MVSFCGRVADWPFAGTTGGPDLEVCRKESNHGTCVCVAIEVDLVVHVADAWVPAVHKQVHENGEGF